MFRTLQATLELHVYFASPIGRRPRSSPRPQVLHFNFESQLIIVGKEGSDH